MKNPRVNLLSYLVSIPLCFFLLSFPVFKLCRASSSIIPGQILRENQTLVSENKHFILGFFRGSSQNLFLGIWHVENSIQRVIWVANKGNPVPGNDSDAILRLSEDGDLVILDGIGGTLWSSNSSSSATLSENWIAELLNTGDLVLSDGDGRVTWQSSDQTFEILDLHPSSNGGLRIFRRLDSTTIGTTKEKRDFKFIFPITLACCILLTAVCGTFIFCFRRRKEMQKEANAAKYGKCGKHVKLPNLPNIEFEEVVRATNGFSTANKLGKGGFGVVYMGKLGDGQEVAVKRLSKKSCQGLHEFANELDLIADIHHPNLVKIVGCCINGEEKILLYEFMPNKSLDTHLFDPIKRVNLDWSKRFRIIMGIARGINHLHCASRLRIVHRDLKASNILLDAEMNPKISDFGMAKIFIGDELQADTKRIVGTYGYLCPEYAKEGRFSEKTDLYSFGVLLLEIVTGKKNSTFTGSQNSLGLLGYVWEMWSEGRSLELVDPSIDILQNRSEALRCIHVGLLCVQRCSCDRPCIGEAISILENDSTEIRYPNRPASYIGESQPSSTPEYSSSMALEMYSVNGLTLTTVEAR